MTAMVRISKNSNNEGWGGSSAGLTASAPPEGGDLKEFGTNGVAGNEEAADDRGSVSAARHRFVTTFDSNTITMRYSVPYRATRRSAPRHLICRGDAGL